MIKKIVFFISFLVYNSMFGQDVLPFVENFTKSAYQGENQVWSLTKGKDNALYFANNHYFLRYNGVIWEKYLLPNKTIIRSVFADSDRIYSGSYNEIGYWKREKGKMHYTSLTPFISKTNVKLKNEEFWKILKYKGVLYFQTFNELFSYKPETNEIKRIKLPSQISYLFVVKNTLYAATINKGIYQYNGNQFIAKPSWSAIQSMVIHGMQSYNDQVYIFTQKNGVFVEKEGQLVSWNHPLNTELKNHLVLCAKIVGNKLVVGTSSNGVYITDFNSNKFITINRTNSLKNNSVLNIEVDNSNDLWLGLDNGIAHIEINSPLSFFIDNTGILGSVYSIAAVKNNLYLGSNHGVFEYSNKNLHRISNSQGQVWSLTPYKDQLIIGHNDGTYVLESNILRKISPINGGWRMKKSIDQSYYIQSNYSGIAFYSNFDSNNVEKLTIEDRPIKEFIQIGLKKILASDSYKGLFVFDYTDSKVKTTNVTQLNHIQNDYNVKLFEFKDETLIFINSVWYTLDKINYKLIRNNLFTSNFSTISDIIPIDVENFAVLRNNQIYLIKNLKDGFEWNFIPSKYYQGRLINNDTRFFKINGHFYINIDDGFISFDSFKTKVVEHPITIELYDSSNGYLIDNSIPNGKPVEIHFISNNYGFTNLDLYYSIDGNELIQINDSKLVLNSITSGNHEISIYSFNRQSKKMIKSLDFYVERPWYASLWMIMLYILILGVIFYLYYRWNKLKYLSKIQLNEEELKHKSELFRIEYEAEQRLKLQEYEKKILENEVKLKENEITGKSLSIAKQAELIENVQNILSEENTITQLKSKLNKAIKTNSISRNEWKAFEENLYASNQDFVKNLTSTFPNLSSKDIKLSIYLKMNLTSKEIAPLMNISYRGVEIHRYRLRKKLHLTSDDNLTNYLNNNF